MADEHGHEWERTGFCRRCHVDHGDLAAREPCPGRPVVRPYGPSPRRRRVEDLALVAYVLRCVHEHPEAHFDEAPESMAPTLVDAMHDGVAPDEIAWPVAPPDDDDEDGA